MIIADREFVEQNSDEMLQNADTQNVAFLVVGDPYGYHDYHILKNYYSIFGSINRLNHIS